ncbi:hypothetical protein [Shewanella zhangzhouensis]|uniref:hypothetical protein n=1 Tax=Shewanella zhangzhouensis TaxID=2864213 RepID=UPI001C65C2CB|nr:hypothetical protein [Shewanella zhangzhouensis]QYK04550.1 hypothetical protein K0H63_16035 [Shewanella zhangzhouensis]
MNSEVKAIIQKAEDTFQTAKFGFDDLTACGRRRRYSGLRNLIVFGRSVTFVIQNLKTPVGSDTFERWYGPIQEQMKSDVVMKYFVTLRNEILKQGKLPVSTSATININQGDMDKLGPPPPGASSFFIGDQLGGSGWIVELPDGSTENYYVDIPTSMADVQQHFTELPVPEDDELKSKPIEELCEYYLDKLEQILDSARSEFLGEQVEKVGKIRLPPYMRVVK